MKNKKLVICILGVILLVVILVLIFNGKSKTLKCMYESSKDSYTSVIETKVSFDNSGDKMNAYNQVLTLTFNDDENIEDNLISLEEICEKYKVHDGVTCIVKKDKKVIKFELNVDVTKLDEDAKEEINLDKYVNYHETKSIMEKASYSCN